MIQIVQGLKVYKYDWITIWKLIVPHRDPSLLPRQWRVAIGTQKSYKLDEVKKEKRRLYEKNRRKCKTADLTGWQNKEVCYSLKLEHLKQLLVLCCIYFMQSLHHIG